MKAIWTQEEATYRGELVNFERIWSHPKPAQKPHPPILMGGDGPTTFDRVIEFCDGWMPIAGRMGNVIEKIATLQKRAKEAGRGPIPVTAFMPKPDRAALAPLVTAGMNRCFPRVHSETCTSILTHHARYTMD